MMLTIERFDESVVIEGPIVQGTNDAVTVTLSPAEYDAMSGLELVQRMREEKRIQDAAFADVEF